MTLADVQAPVSLSESAVTRGRYTALTQDHGFHGVGMHEFTRGDLVVSGGGALSHYGDRWMGLGIGGCGIVDAGIGVQNPWSSVGKVFRKAKEKEHRVSSRCPGLVPSPRYFAKLTAEPARYRHRNRL